MVVHNLDRVGGLASGKRRKVQIVVFELSKDSFEEVIADLEEKTGLPLEVEVEESGKKK